MELKFLLLTPPQRITWEELNTITLLNKHSIEVFHRLLSLYSWPSTSLNAITKFSCNRCRVIPRLTTAQHAENE